jgi:predicted SAM-dependent methyltransferase
MAKPVNLPFRILRRLRREVSSVRGRLFRPALPARAGEQLLIHIGCGDIDREYFVNVDAQPFPHVHFVRNDITNLSMFQSNSADLIYMCHILEHIARRDMDDVLQELRRVLKPGGVLRISVPDFDHIVALYEASDREIDAIDDPLLGSHANDYDVHYAVFNRRSLEAIFRAAGFGAVSEWNPGNCDHHDFEDWASRRLEYRGREFPISLNLEAVK